MPRDAPVVAFVAPLAVTHRAFLAPLAAQATRAGYRTVGVVGESVGARDLGSEYDSLCVISAFRRVGLRQLVRAVAQLRHVLIRHEVTVAHLNTPYAVAIGRIACLSTGIRSICVIHGTLLDTHDAKSIVFRVAETCLAWTSRHYIAMNAEDASFYQRVSLGARVNVAPCGGAGIRQFNPRLVESTRPQPIILVLGRLTPEKGLDLAVAAWLAAREAIPNLILRFVGGPVEGDVPWRPPPTPGIESQDWVADLSTEFATAALLLCASPREGFSLVVAEALSAGLPVVAVSNRGTREIARALSDDSMLVEATPDELARAIVENVSQPRTVSISQELRDSWDTRSVTAFHMHELRRAIPHAY